MSRTNFENLTVYALAEELSDSIWEITTQWDGFNRDTIGKQIVRSADSINSIKPRIEKQQRTTNDEQPTNL